ncbi:hypothetical protein B0H11DRAFT_1923865 [Mycena galericulata]|nr:hypothetical protein B0H11DRAFT_1923865 [Mycena galericulata]
MDDNGEHEVLWLKRWEGLIWEALRTTAALLGKAERLRGPTAHFGIGDDGGIEETRMEWDIQTASGGWWKPTGSQDYTQAGPEIISFLRRNKELQRRLGWMDKFKPKPGQLLIPL